MYKENLVLPRIIYKTKKNDDVLKNKEPNDKKSFQNRFLSINDMIEKNYIEIEKASEEEKILENLIKQTLTIENLIMKLREKDEKTKKIIEKKFKKFEEREQEIDDKKETFHYINRRIEDQFKNYLSYGLGYNPYYPK